MSKNTSRANFLASQSSECPDDDGAEAFTLESDVIFGPDIARHLSEAELDAEFAYIEKCFAEKPTIVYVERS